MNIPLTTIPDAVYTEYTFSRFGPKRKEAKVGQIVYLAQRTPLKLDSGAEIRNFPLAFQTYGKLNKAKSNAVLVCHGLTGDQYLIGKHPVTGKPGWWERMVGAGKPIDTEKYFVICSNVLGGCMGSFGPKEINPKTDKPYNLDFPVITIRDMVKAQALLLDYLGIDTLLSAIGGSMGGMQALTWAVTFPRRVRSVVPIAAAVKHTAQNIAFHEIGRQAIIADPEWSHGNYLNEGKYPSKGLAVARMTAHVTYLSESKLTSKFGRSLQDRDALSYGFEADFRIESYLRHQGQSFVDRFDANSYLYITRAMDYFDLSEEESRVESQGDISDRQPLKTLFSLLHKPNEHYHSTLDSRLSPLTSHQIRYCVISFSSDWLFTTAESRKLVHMLNAAAANVSFVDIETDKGHDAFLLDEPELRKTIRGFLGGVRRGLKSTM